MLVFNRTSTELAKAVLYTLCGGLLGLFVTSLLELPVWVRVLGTAALLAAVGLLLIAGEALRVELADNGDMKVYVMGKLRREFNLHRVELSMPTTLPRRGLRQPMPNMILHIIDPKTQKPFKLDCAPLGRAQYEQLCARIREMMDLTNQRELDA